MCFKDRTDFMPPTLSVATLTYSVEVHKIVLVMIERQQVYKWGDY
jgi:hypothetical protein